MPYILASECEADGNIYACGRSNCHHMRPCASDPGLLACSCKPATYDQVLAAKNNPAMTEALALVSPCVKVEVGKPLRDWSQCKRYLSLPLNEPRQCKQWSIPSVIHAMGPSSLPPLMVAAVNPKFRLHHLNDEKTRDYVLNHCGKRAAQAYDCFVAPAFKADLARFCILVTEGGVYLDADIILTAPVHQVVDMCGGASIGYDIPQLPLTGKPRIRQGKQMKILAGERGHPLFKCMLIRIIRNVETRSVPPFPLLVSGPQLLHKCYERVANKSEVHITYRDTRGAKWPYTGMMGLAGHVAFETTGKGPNHYHKLYLNKRVYTGTWPLRNKHAQLQVVNFFKLC